jgi:hypothetical protein
MHNCAVQTFKRDRAICHAKPPALAIRLTPGASFPEKLRQLIVKMRKEKAPPKERFCISKDGPLSRQFE